MTKTQLEKAAELNLAIDYFDSKLCWQLNQIIIPSRAEALLKQAVTEVIMPQLLKEMEGL